MSNHAVWEKLDALCTKWAVPKMDRDPTQVDRVLYSLLLIATMLDAMAKKP